MGSQPVASARLQAQKQVTDVPVSDLRTISYEFDTSATSKGLKLPYAICVDGKVQDAFAKKPRALTPGDRKIVVAVRPGRKVSLYLNSDAHRDFRTAPVYEVLAGGNDVSVQIKELKGKHSELAVVGKPKVASDASGKRATDHYAAALTGDIWMSISHRYSEAEARERLPDDCPQAICDAVLAIYRGLPTPQLTIDFPASDSAPAHKLHITFQEQESVVSNTTNCPLLTEALPRTHPLAFAALFQEAHKARISDIAVTSCWRPSLGEIVHRVGLGLDITFVQRNQERVAVNRAALVSSNRSGPNVTADERDLYRKYEESKKNAFSLEQRRDAVSARVERAKGDEKKNLQAELDQLNSQVRNQKSAMGADRERWERAVDDADRPAMRDLRTGLHLNALVDQILDPWYMDLDTHNSQSRTPNEQKTKLEQLHNNHLHITIREPGLP
ncbi:MAG: hypothetical protein ACXU8N_15310 [Telluria sp.]